LIDGLRDRGALVLCFDPLMTVPEIERTGAIAWPWGRVDPTVAAVITQTADRTWGAIDPGWFPALRALVDGRNSLRDLPLPGNVHYLGIGGRQ
jgi:hypothetical protein